MDNEVKAEKKRIAAYKFIILIVVIGALAVISFFVYKKFIYKQFGNSTISLAVNGNYQLSCEDANSLVDLLKKIGMELNENQKISDKLQKNTITPSMTEFENIMDAFSLNLEKKFKGNKDLLDKAIFGIGASVANLVQASVLLNLNMVSEEKFKEFLNVSYCGAVPSEGYSSPLKILEEKTAEKNNEISEESKKAVNSGMN